MGAQSKDLGLQSKERESKLWKPSRPRENMHQAQGGRRRACVAVALSVRRARGGGGGGGTGLWGEGG